MQKKEIADVVRERIAVDKTVAEEEESDQGRCASSPRPSATRTSTIIAAEAEAAGAAGQAHQGGRGGRGGREAQGRASSSIAGRGRARGGRQDSAQAKIRLAEGMQAEAAAPGPRRGAGQGGRRRRDREAGPGRGAGQRSDAPAQREARPASRRGARSRGRGELSAEAPPRRRCRASSRPRRSRDGRASSSLAEATGLAEKADGDEGARRGRRASTRSSGCGSRSERTIELERDRRAQRDGRSPGAGPGRGVQERQDRHRRRRRRVLRPLRRARSRIGKAVDGVVGRSETLQTRARRLPRTATRSLVEDLEGRSCRGRRSRPGDVAEPDARRAARPHGRQAASGADARSATELLAARQGARRSTARRPRMTARDEPRRHARGSTDRGRRSSGGSYEVIRERLRRAGARARRARPRRSTQRAARAVRRRRARAARQRARPHREQLRRRATSCSVGGHLLFGFNVFIGLQDARPRSRTSSACTRFERDRRRGFDFTAVRSTGAPALPRRPAVRQASSRSSTSYYKDARLLQLRATEAQAARGLPDRRAADATSRSSLGGRRRRRASSTSTTAASATTPSRRARLRVDADRRARTTSPGRTRTSRSSTRSSSRPSAAT